MSKVYWPYWLAKLVVGAGAVHDARRAVPLPMPTMAQCTSAPTFASDSCGTVYGVCAATENDCNEENGTFYGEGCGNDGSCGCCILASRDGEERVVGEDDDTGGDVDADNTTLDLLQELASSWN